MGKTRTMIVRQTPYTLDGVDDRLVRPWREVRPKLEKWLERQLRTPEQINDAIDAIRGKKDVEALTKKLKYFYGPKTVYYGVRESTNMRTDAAKVAIKCFCYEKRGLEIIFVIHGVAKGGIRVMSLSTLQPIEDTVDHRIVPGHEGEIEYGLNLMICSKQAGFILGYSKMEKSLFFHLFEKCDTNIVSYKMEQNVFSMKYSVDFGHLFVAVRGIIKRYMLSTSKSGGFTISLVPLADLFVPMAPTDACYAIVLDELACHITLFCERDVYNADFEENKPLSRYSCMHDNMQAKVTCMVKLHKHNYLITGATDGSVKVWNFEKLTEVSNLDHDEVHAVNCVAVTQTRAVTLLLIGFTNCVALLWRLDYLKIAQRIEMPSPIIGLGFVSNNDFYVICTCGIFVYDVRGIYIMYSYTTGRFPLIRRVENHGGFIPEILALNRHGEIFTLSCIRGVVTSETTPLLYPWPESATFDLYLEQSHEAIFQLYPDGSIIAFNRTHFKGMPLCRYNTPDIVVSPDKEKREKKGDDDDSSSESDSDDSDSSNGDDSDDSGSNKKNKESNKHVIPMRVKGFVCAGMNRLTDGHAKNEREIMMQLKNTLQGASAMEDVPLAVPDADDLVIFAGMCNGTIVLVDAINYVMDEPVQAHKHTISKMFLSKANKKLEDFYLCHFEHIVTVGTEVADGPRYVKIWTVTYSLVKVEAPPHLKGRAAERFLRRGPKYFRQINLAVLQEFNLGNLTPKLIKMMGNVLAYTRTNTFNLEMYSIKSPGHEGDLVRYLEPRYGDEHLAEPTCLDSNPTLMLFLSTSEGGFLKIWNSQNILLRNIYFEKDYLYGAGFINKKGDLLVSYDGIFLCIPGEAYHTPFVVEDMLQDDSPFVMDDESADPLPTMKGKAATRRIEDLPSVVVCSGERKKIEAGLVQTSSERRIVRKDYESGEAMMLQLEKKKKVEEEEEEVDGYYGPFGYFYKRVVIDADKSWSEGLSKVRSHYVELVEKLPKRMTKDNRRAYKHYEFCIMKALEFLDEKLMFPHHKSTDEHFFVPMADYEINQKMLDKLQKLIEDEEKRLTRETTIPQPVEQRVRNLRALALAPEGDEALEQKSRYPISVIRAEMGSLRYPATFRDHIYGKWTALTPEEIEEIFAEMMREHLELQARNKGDVQGGDAGAKTQEGAVVPVEQNKNARSNKNENKSKNKKKSKKKGSKNKNQNRKKSSRDVTAFPKLPPVTGLVSASSSAVVSASFNSALFSAPPSTSALPPALPTAPLPPPIPLKTSTSRTPSFSLKDFLTPFPPARFSDSTPRPTTTTPQAVTPFNAALANLRTRRPKSAAALPPIKPRRKAESPENEDDEAALVVPAAAPAAEIDAETAVAAANLKAIAAPATSKSPDWSSLIWTDPALTYDRDDIRVFLRNIELDPEFFALDEDWRAEEPLGVEGVTEAV